MVFILAKRCLHVACFLLTDWSCVVSAFKREGPMGIKWEVGLLKCLAKWAVIQREKKKLKLQNPNWRLSV
jgi:hypothetical protein